MLHPLTFFSELHKDYITPKLGSVLSKITGNLKNPTASEYSSKTILASQLADWDCALGGKWCMEMTSKLFIEWQSGSPDFKDPFVDLILNTILLFLFLSILDLG